MKTDHKFFKKDKEREEVLKECRDMIMFYRSAPFSNKNQINFRNRMRYYIDLKNKLMSDIRLEKMLKRNKV